MIVREGCMCLPRKGRIGLPCPSVGQGQRSEWYHRYGGDQHIAGQAMRAELASARHILLGERGRERRQLHCTETVSIEDA